MDVKYCIWALGPCMQLTHPEYNSFLDIHSFSEVLKSVLNDYLFLTCLDKRKNGTRSPEVFYDDAFVFLFTLVET